MEINLSNINENNIFKWESNILRKENKTMKIKKKIDILVYDANIAFDENFFLQKILLNN